MGQEVGYCRGVLRGIHAYALHKDHWVFHDGPPDIRILKPLREWQPHGIIAHLYDQELAERLLTLHRPLVSTTNTLPDLPVPIVDADHERVGKLAAEHFLQRGYRHFGYFGSSWTVFSREREKSFRRALAEAGFELSSCYAEYLPHQPLDSSWKRVDQQICDWLSSLPRPAAILASNDTPARRLSEMCRELGVRVPYDVALLGVDNDEVQCLLAQPPLSSVVNPAEQIGFEAAKLLDRLMAGQHPPSAPLVVAPPYVVTRASTDIVAIGDAEVSAAVAYIRDHIAENIGVGDVVDGIGAARRGLERRFRKLLGRSVLEEIQQVRVDRAKQLLAETDLPMRAVARGAGFSTRQRMAAIFQQIARESPIAFRRRLRGQP
jgi:LacI family transcriptional regulator